MFNLNRHELFETWIDPVSGIKSYLLKEEVAPFQQSFYFTNHSVSRDGKWLWFYAAYPPNPQKILGVVCLDPDNPFIRCFNHAAFVDASPMVAPEGSAVYYAMQNKIYKMDIEGNVETIIEIPKEFFACRHYSKISTHLSMSADGKYILLDGDLGNFWWVGIGNVETGEFKLLKEFPNHHNHSIFSPTDPKLFMIPEDNGTDKISGHRFMYTHRIWIMDIDQTRFEPIRPKDWYEHNSNASHEWWSQDGMICWNDYAKGTFECDPYTLKTEHVWRRPLCHAHCDSKRRYWCADQTPYQWHKKPVEILFYDRKTGMEKKIVSAMPRPSASLLDNTYHIHPHPQFSKCDNWIIYTTTVRQRIDVALTSIQDIVKSDTVASKSNKK